MQLKSFIRKLHEVIFFYLRRDMTNPTKPFLISLCFLFTSFGAVAQTAGLTWVTYTGSLPENTVYGGSENGRQLAICRCNYNGAMHPGKVVNGNCNIGWGGREIVSRNFEVLTLTGNRNLVWIPLNQNQLARLAIPAGQEGNNTLYIGRIQYAGGTHPGKIFGSPGRYICNIGYGGREISTSSGIEVLVNRPRQNGAGNQAAANTRGDCTTATGVYQWSDGNFIQFKADNKVKYFMSDQIGTWSCGPNGQISVYKVDGGTDTYYLSADGSSIYANNSAVGRRLSDSEQEALKMQREIGDQLEEGLETIKSIFNRD